MNNNFAIIGGDSRIAYLAEILASEGNTIYGYGIGKTNDISNILNCKNIEESVKNAKIIISAIPFSKDGIHIYAPFCKENINIEELSKYADNKILMAGSIPSIMYEASQNKNTKIIDLMEEEDLTVLNTIATAEGAISEIITNTKTILHKSKVLILGFGRVAKVLAKKLVGLDVRVTCSARKDKDFAWMEALGYNSLNINELGENLQEYDIIINTVPYLIIDEEKIQYIKNDCLLMDLASKPGGIDQNACNKKGIKFIWALALPGKIAPISSAKYIKNTIFNIIRKEKIISI